MSRLDPESVDLAAVASLLHEACGGVSIGAAVGRTVLRDEIVRHLGCSMLEGENLVDTMVARGFIERHEDRLGTVRWVPVAR